MAGVRPNAEQFRQLASSPDAGPVVMLNLLKFKRRAGGEEHSGQEAYMRYGEAAARMIRERGGRILWQGRADQVLIGDPAQNWDAVALVEYPSRKAFMEMVSAPEYQQSHAHRQGGLERTIVIACTPVADRTVEAA